MIRFLFLFTIFIYISLTGLFAQNNFLFGTYQFDKFNINPSYIAENNFTQVNLVHKRLWTGIEGAPVISGINIQHSISDKIGIGLNLVSDRRILLSDNNLNGSVSYRLIIAKHHKLHFGLSLGASFSEFEADDVANIIDPVFDNINKGTLKFQSRFGINYRYKSFGIGWALPQLVDNSALFETNKNFTSLDNFIINGFYHHKVTSSLSIEPYGLFMRINDNFNLIELGFLGIINEVLAIGGSYQNTNGLGILTKMSFGNMELAYAYQDGRNLNLSFASATHEIQTKFNLSKTSSTGKENSYSNRSYRKHRKRIRRRRLKQLKQIRKPRY